MSNREQTFSTLKLQVLWTNKSQLPYCDPLQEEYGKAALYTACWMHAVVNIVFEFTSRRHTAGTVCSALITWTKEAIEVGCFSSWTIFRATLIIYGCGVYLDEFLCDNDVFVPSRMDQSIFAVYTRRTIQPEGTLKSDFCLDAQTWFYGLFNALSYKKASFNFSYFKKTDSLNRRSTQTAIVFLLKLSKSTNTTIYFYASKTWEILVWTTNFEELNINDSCM